MMKLKAPRPSRTPQHKALLGFILSVATIAVGLFYMIPAHEAFGTLWTMIGAIAAGTYYTRYNQLKKK